MIIGAFWFAASSLIAPANQSVGSCPFESKCENIEFQSDSGTTIKGWFLSGETGKGAIILMHGVRSNRLSLIERMKFLNRAGYSVLAFDFQASGESIGKQITFGYLESLDAKASIKFLRDKIPNEKIGVIGISMGSAAFMLQKTPQKVDALVLEMVYPAMETAVKDRLNLWLFDGAEIFSPFLTWQLQPRLGISKVDLRPIDNAAKISTPKFFIVGEMDKHTTLAESWQFFETSAEPKEMWIVEKAEHTDLHQFSSQDYEEKVLSFFQRYLRNQ